MVRYSLLRLLVFFGCVVVLWLLGWRSREDLVPLILVAALVSMVISFFALRPFRQAYSAQIADKLQARADAKVSHGVDEVAEDAEDDQGKHGDQDEQGKHGVAESGSDADFR